MSKIAESIQAQVKRDRLVQLAADLIEIPSPTGQEEPIARYLCDILNGAGLVAKVHPIESGRANVVGRLKGHGLGRSLMLNGHIDTSYSGAEPWSSGPGFGTTPLVEDERLIGLGVVNMKGAIACYVEAVRALDDAGIELEGDLVIAGVAGETEKAPYPEEFSGPSYRGYGAGSRHLVTHGGVADGCIIGEPTEEHLVLGHCGSLWISLSLPGEFMHTAATSGRLSDNAAVRVAELTLMLVAWADEWKVLGAYQGLPGLMSIGAVRAGLPWRLSRTPHLGEVFVDIRVPPDMTMQEAIGHFGAFVARAQERYPGLISDVFLSAPGAELAIGHDIVKIVDAAHRAVAGRPATRKYTYWASDASTLARYGIPTINYGPSSGGWTGGEGEAVPVASLTRMATAYAICAAEWCGVA